MGYDYSLAEARREMWSAIFLELSRQQIAADCDELTNVVMAKIDELSG